MEPLPSAFPQLPATGVMRRCPEDFAVDETLDLNPSGGGEHLYLRVEKRGLNTIAVAQSLADAAEVPLVDIGYAGMKDRHAVTRQWFSVHTPRHCLALSPGLDARVLERTRHVRKLRRGQILANRFEIMLRDVTGDRAAVETRLGAIRDGGVPNYFGAQRFGRDGGNLTDAWQWLSRRPRRRLSPYRRGILLSAARASLFNAVLAARIRHGNWNHLIDGDIADDDLPTGPLWGRGRSPATGACLTIEIDALAAHREWLEPLEHVGLTQQRRVLIARPTDFTWSWQGTDLALGFALPSGSYATGVIAELGRFAEPGDERLG